MRPLSVLALLLFASVCYSDETILMKTVEGYFIIEVVDGLPSAPVPLEDWWTAGQVIHSNGDQPSPPRPDAIAKQVDKWADEAGHPESSTRKLIGDGWQSVIEDVKDPGNSVNLDKAWRHLSAVHAEILDGLPQEQAAAWGLFVQKVSVLLDDAITAGTYSVATLESVLKGLRL